MIPPAPHTHTHTHTHTNTHTHTSGILVLKKSCIFCTKLGDISWFSCILFGIFRGDSLLIILGKQQIFLYQRLCWRDSKPNSWKYFFLQVPLTALVIANAALYWIDSIFWWSKGLYATLCYIINHVSVRLSKWFKNRN